MYPVAEAAAYENLKPSANKDVQQAAVEALIHRILGHRSQEVQVVIDPSLGPSRTDTFKLEKSSEEEKLKVTGSSGVAAAFGFNHYLKYFCNVHISWEVEQLQVPEKLPPVQLKVSAQDKFRYFSNVCTWSYSYVWWGWEEWQKHIDWMALNGINFPLAFNGQETIWRKIYLSLGLTQKELDSFFTGPAFLAWGRMGNLQGWGGPLPRKWYEQQLHLNQQIVAAMRDLGMIPILPAFAGHIPHALTRVFPDAKVHQLGPWAGFNCSDYSCVMVLDPTDPLFTKLGSAFIQEQRETYNGTDHAYNCDPFNEMQPSSDSDTYLKSVGKSIFLSMTLADSSAIWVLQGWLFNDESYWTKGRAHSLLTSVPLGHLIVLDLQAEVTPQYERLDGFFGQPYIWCMLHDFGGVLGMHGDLKSVNLGVVKSRQYGAEMIGTGMTMEGINQNYVVYDFMSETSWRDSHVDIYDWAQGYALRRYGTSDKNLAQAWRILMEQVYLDSGGGQVHGRYAITKRPSLTLQPEGIHNLTMWGEVWSLFIKSEGPVTSLETFKYDLVDITRQTLQVLCDFYFVLSMSAFAYEDKHLFRVFSKTFLEIMADEEKILSTEKHFLLGLWLASAKKFATTQQEEALYELNARNQITLWGPTGEIRDYAAKQWSGIVRDYFAPRYKMFFTELRESLESGKKFQQKLFDEQVFLQVEQPFTLQHQSFPINPQGDALERAQEIFSKWKDHLNSTQLPENPFSTSKDPPSDVFSRLRRM